MVATIQWAWETLAQYIWRRIIIHVAFVWKQLRVVTNRQWRILDSSGKKQSIDGRVFKKVRSNRYLSVSIFQVVNGFHCDKNSKRSSLTLSLGISGPERLIPRVLCELITKVVYSWNEIRMISSLVYVWICLSISRTRYFCSFHIAQTSILCRDSTHMYIRIAVFVPGSCLYYV